MTQGEIYRGGQEPEAPEEEAGDTYDQEDAEDEEFSPDEASAQPATDPQELVAQAQNVLRQIASRPNSEQQLRYATQIAAQRLQQAGIDPSFLYS